MDLHGTAAGGEEIMMQEVVDQINKCVLAQLENVHTAIPGEIKEYDPDKGVATVQPKAKFKKPDGNAGLPGNIRCSSCFPTKSKSHCRMGCKERGRLLAHYE